METILTALIAGATAGLKGIVSHAIKDTYNALKKKISDKFGSDNGTSTALQQLEKKPESSAKQASLKEEIIEMKLDQDHEIEALAKKLIESLQAEKGGGEHIKNIQHVIGDHNIVVGSGSSVNISKL